MPNRQRKHITIGTPKKNCTKPTRQCGVAKHAEKNIYPFVKFQHDIYHCCVYSEKLLMMERGIVRNMQNFIPKINLRN